MKRFLGLAILALFIVPSWCAIGLADTSFRCGNKLIDLGDIMQFVRQECGNPISEERVGARTTYTILPADHLKVKDETYLVEWIYKKDNGYYILTFEGSRLMKKEYVK
jgi:hypothetical protein